MISLYVFTYTATEASIVNFLTFLQILKAIWEEVSANFPVTWLDVLEFRETHFCTPKQSINALNYRFHHKQYQEQSRSNSYTQNSTVHHNTLPLITNNHSWPPMAPQCYYETNGCFPNNYATYAPVASHYGYPVPLSYPTALKAQHYPTNGYCCNNMYPGYVCAVPTGQLIELEPQSASYDTVDGVVRQHKGSVKNNDMYSHKNSNVIVNNVESDKDEGFETWDYVYKNLESKGYSKDLGDREDILAMEEAKTRQKKVKATNLDEALNNLTVSDRPLKINEALEKYKENDRDRRKEEPKKHSNVTPTSSYENLSHSKSKSAPKQKSPKEKLKVSRTEMKKTKEAKPAESATKEVVCKWQCGHCTYLNDDSREICEMCSKSRLIIEQKMEIGGSQCPKCTLVNPRDAAKCQACEESLKDSPTYI